MPLCASTGPVLGRCCQHRHSTGPVLATTGMFTEHLPQWWPYWKIAAILDFQADDSHFSKYHTFKCTKAKFGAFLPIRTILLHIWTHTHKSFRTFCVRNTHQLCHPAKIDSNLLFLSHVGPGNALFLTLLTSCSGAYMIQFSFVVRRHPSLSTISTKWISPYSFQAILTKPGE